MRDAVNSTPGVMLQGVLIERMFYGPPGFGKTPARDLRVKVLVLRLADPITVASGEDAPARNCTSPSTVKYVREIQLVFGSPSDESSAHKFLGKPVIVYGKQHEATAPHQYTDVIVQVWGLRPR